MLASTACVAVEVERILADEVRLVVGEPVHRVARADADVAGVVVDAHDRRREVGPRPGIPRGRERRIERQPVVADLDARAIGASRRPARTTHAASTRPDRRRRRRRRAGSCCRTSAGSRRRPSSAARSSTSTPSGPTRRTASANRQRVEQLGVRAAGTSASRAAERRRPPARKRRRRAVDVPLAARRASPTATATPWGRGRACRGRGRWRGRCPVPPPSIASRRAGPPPAWPPGVEVVRRRSTAPARWSRTSRDRVQRRRGDERRSVRRPVTASTAWTNASSPVAAVTCGGMRHRQRRVEHDERGQQLVAPRPHLAAGGGRSARTSG